MNVERDSWLSAILGYDAFRLSLENRNGTSLSDELMWPMTKPAHEFYAWWASRVSTSGRAFYYTSVPTERVDILLALSGMGFRVVDVAVTYLRQPNRASGSVPDGSGVVRGVLLKDHEAVLDIAGSCFVYSRFHLDPEIPKETAHAIKRNWIDSYLRKQRGERLWVALLEDKPVGFLADLGTDESQRPCRVIDLLGVDKAFQGRGVGRALVSALLEQAGKESSWLRAGTQAANIPSIRLYEGLGFRVSETAYVLHAHVHAKKGLP